MPSEVEPPPTQDVDESPGTSGEDGATAESLAAPEVGSEAFVLPAVGEVFAERFMIEEILGGAPSGPVYRAEDQKSGSTVALRILSPEMLADVKLDELKASVDLAASLRAKSVVRVHGWRDHGGGIYVVSELVAGQRLADLIASKRKVGKPFTGNGAYNILVHVLAGLQAAHAKGLSHGDLRPENVLIDGRGRVKLADFGTGRALAAVRWVKGPLNCYDPPEDVPDQRADIRAAGLMFAELYTGAPPEEAVAALPEAVAAVLNPYLATNPADRPESVTQLRDDLSKVIQAASNRPAAAKVPPPPPPPSAGGPQPRQNSNALFRQMIDDLGTPEGRKSDERWLAHKDGLDYGPFAAEELVERLKSGEFSGDTVVQDLTTGTRKPLDRVEELQKPVKRVLAAREAHSKVERATRSARIKTAKAAGRGLAKTTVLGIALVVVVVSYFFGRTPFPKPISFAEVTLSFGGVLQQPRLEPVEIAAKRRFKAERKRRRRARRKADNRLVDSYGEGGEVVTELALDGDEGDDGAMRAPFNQGSVDRVLATAQGSFRRCMKKELKRNPKLGSITLEFWMQPGGVPAKARVDGRGTPKFGKCMLGVVQGLRFPAFDGMARKVSLPFSVAR